MFIYRKAEVGMAIDMIYERPTTEKNGVKVIIPIKESDYADFKKKILEKCAYFEQVYFHIEDKPYYSWDTNKGILTELNNFTIIDTPHFKYSTLDASGRCKILLGRINYQLNYYSLGISGSYDVPIALKFNLTEGIYPSPNREDIKYTKEAQLAILKKLRNSCEWLINKFNEQVENISELKDWLNYFTNATKYVCLNPLDSNPVKVNITETFKLYGEVCKRLNSLENTDEYNITLTLKLPVLERYPVISSLITKDSTKQVPFLFNRQGFLLQGFSTIAKVGASYTTRGFKSDIDNIATIIQNPEKYLLSSEQISAKKGQRDYIKEKFKNLTIISPRKYKMTLGKPSKKDWGNNIHTYIGLLNLSFIDRNLWRPIITEWQTVEQEIIDLLLKPEDVTPTKEWLDSKKVIKEKNKQSADAKERLKNKLKEEVNLKLACSLEKYSDNWKCKFEPTYIKISELHKLPYLVVYGTDDDRIKLDNIYRFCIRHESIYKRTKKGSPYKGGIRPAILGQRDREKLKEFKIHNIKSIEQFMSESGKLIGKYVTAKKINDFLDKEEVKKLLKSSNDIKEHISERFATNLESLESFRNQYTNIPHFTGIFAEALTKIVEENNYWDLSVLATLKEVEKDLKKLDFLHLFINKRYSYSSSYHITKEAIPLIHEILRGRKFRMDSKHYPKLEIHTEDNTINPNIEEDETEIGQEEILTEELIIDSID